MSSFDEVEMSPELAAAVVAALLGARAGQIIDEADGGPANHWADKALLVRRELPHGGDAWRFGGR